MQKKEYNKTMETVKDFCKKCKKKKECKFPCCKAVLFYEAINEL